MSHYRDDSQHPGALSCDLASGVCVPAQPPAATTVRVTYVTDPICSACWAMEPAWRAVELLYGDLLDVRHVYGGLLPGWTGYADPGAGISGPADVATHWEEIARHSGQPIDPSVWHTDPLESSFPASIAVAAARLVAPEREGAFLRHLREQLFLDARNISRPQTWRAAAEAVGIDYAALRRHVDDGSARQAFSADLTETDSLRAYAFPTLFLESGDDRMTLRGAQSFQRIEAALLAISGQEARPRSVTVEQAITRLGTGTTTEYATVLGMSTARVETTLAAAGLRRVEATGGVAWRP